MQRLKGIFNKGEKITFIWLGKPYTGTFIKVHKDKFLIEAYWNNCKLTVTVDPSRVCIKRAVRIKEIGGIEELDDCKS